jgi:hypothetical protein
MLLGWEALREHGDDGIAVRFFARWQPKGDSGKVVQGPDSLFGESVAAERGKELGKVSEIIR